MYPIATEEVEEPTYRSLANWLDEDEDDGGPFVVPTTEAACLQRHVPSGSLAVASWAGALRPGARFVQTRSLRQPSVNRASSWPLCDAPPDAEADLASDCCSEESDGEESDTEVAADDLLHKLARLQVSNSRLQTECTEMKAHLVDLVSINEGIRSVVAHGGAAQGGASPLGSVTDTLSASERRPAASYAAVLSLDTSTAVHPLITTRLPTPEIAHTKRPRSFTSELAAEPLHPHKQQIDGRGVPQRGDVSVARLRELIAIQRGRREELLQQMQENATVLGTLQQMNAVLREQLAALQEEMTRVATSAAPRAGTQAAH